MANLFFKKIFGQIPSTEKFVTKYEALRKEMYDYDAFTNSEKLKRFRQLEEIINSSSHQNNKLEIKKLRYIGSAEQKLEAEYLSLLTNKDLQRFLKIKDSPELQKYTSIKESREYNKYVEFKTIIESGEIEKIRKKLNQERKVELAYQKKFKSLANSSTIRKYFTLINSTEYIDYQTINNSTELKEYQILKTKVDQFNYKQITKENQSEFETEIAEKARLSTLETNQQLKNYFTFTKKKLPEFIKSTENSPLLKEYNELKNYIESPDYTKKLETTNFDTTEAAQLAIEYKKLKQLPEIVFLEKFEKSKNYKSYRNIIENPILDRYNELKIKVNADTFIERKNYLSDNKKYEKTEEYQLEQEYKSLQSDSEIIWYVKSSKTDKFAEPRKWNPLFEETFNSLDNDKWLTIPFQGMLNLKGQSYVPEGNMQFHTDGKNLHIDNGLQIETRQESYKGLRWQQSSGFKMRDFEYTSGIINTGHSFRINRGKIDILAKMTNYKEVIHAATLKADTIAPHIDIFCTGTKKGLKTRLFLSNQDKPDFEQTITGLNFENKYLFTLEWEEFQLKWKINGVEVAEYKGNLPKNALYLAISSVLIRKPSTLPAHLFIDSVKIYERQK